MRGIRILCQPLARSFIRSRVPNASMLSPLRLPRYLSTDGKQLYEEKMKELEVLKKSFGSNDEKTINLMSQVAHLMKEKGDLNGAEQLYKEADAEIRSKFGDFHPNTYMSMANLGTIYGHQGRIDESISLLQEASDGFKPLEEMYRPVRIEILKYKAMLLRKSGKLEEALRSFDEAIEEKKLDAVKSPAEEGMDLLGEYGIIQRDLKRYDESIATLTTALNNLKETVGDDLKNPMVAYMNFQLAVSYEAAERFLEAEEIYARIHKEKLIDYDAVGFREVMSRYEDVLTRQGKYSELETIFAELEPLVKQKLGPGDVIAVYCLTTLAKAKHGMGDLKGSVALLKEGRSHLQEAENGKEKYAFDIAQLANNIGSLLHKDGNLDEAEIYFKEAMDQFRAISKNPDLSPEACKVLWENIIAFHRNFSSFLEDADRCAEASQVYHTLLNELAANHSAASELSSAISSYNSLAITLLEKKMFREAEAAFKVCLKHQMTLDGGESAEAYCLRINVADSLRAQEKLAEAEALLQRSVPSLIELLGRKNQFTIHGMTILSFVYSRLGKYSLAEPLLRDCLEFSMEAARTDDSRIPEVLSRKCNLGVCVFHIGNRREEGIAIIRTAVEHFKRASLTSHEGFINANIQLASCLSANKDYDEAISILVDTVRSTQQLFGNEHLISKLVESHLSAVRQASRDYRIDK